MQPQTFQQIVLNSPRRLALPIATYPALAFTGAKVSDIVTNPRAQLEAQSALRERYGSGFALSAMDLSAEAEAFGCNVVISDAEIPTVTGRLVTTLEQAKALAVPQPGDKRTSVYLESVRLLHGMEGAPFVFGGCIGPFSLAARLVGVSEALELTLADPELMHTALEKSATFLANYIKAFRTAGARGVLMAEPAAGLLSPRGVSSFSSAYIRRIAAEVNDASFTLLLHNCAAKLLHLPAIRETGLTTFHFGAPMDLVAALKQVPPDVVLCGNLDPAAVFVQSTPAETEVRVAQLLSATAAHRNYVISSGCDVPPNAPLANVDAFYRAVNAVEQHELGAAPRHGRRAGNGVAKTE
ncbi:MAG TPA: uroporphyrinogen decarboxylase family protein [Verrucomicrobiae bacterium]